MAEIPQYEYALQHLVTVREKGRTICLLQSGFPSVKAKEEAQEEHVAVFQPSNPIHKSCNP
jgi:pyruvate-formate lyase-activating enzyme